MTLRLRLPLGALLVLLVAAPALAAHDFYTITVVDKITGTPLPNVRVSTINNVVLKSDASGRINFYEPGIMGTSVWLSYDTCNGSTCNLDHSIACSTHADCNAGHEPAWVNFIGCWAATGLVPVEQGTVQLRLCPAGTATACPNPPGSCVSDAVTGSSMANPIPTPAQRFRIQVADAATGRGVPLIEVRSPSQTFVTDSAGLVAYHESALMGTTVHFDVSGHGYAATSADLLATAGGTATIPITRNNVAERIYRVTGGGIYRDTVLMEETAPLVNPVINSLVFGQDTAQTAVYKNKLFWIWGDTNRPSFPLGLFRAPGAQSDLPSLGGLDPDVGVNLDYFGDGAGFVKAMCSTTNFPNPPGYTGSTPCWMFSLSVVKDGSNNERLYALYVLVSAGEVGWGRFNDSTQTFDKIMAFPLGLVISPAGQPDKVRHGATDWLYYVHRGSTGAFASIPVDNPVRIGATELKITDPTKWEAFTAIKTGTTDELVIRTDGTLNYDWKTNAPVITGTTGPIYFDGTNFVPIPTDQRLFGHAKNPDTGLVFRPHNVATAFNPHRKRWVQTVQATFDSSFLGEVYYDEADTPMGPWVYGRKIVSHNNYSFYNTRLHPYFNQDDGRFIFFENTYTTYLTSAVPTPRYNYNQVMYRLDTDDPRVVLPVPVYDLAGSSNPGNFVTKAGIRPGTGNETAVFMAPDRAGAAGTIPFWWNDASCKNRVLMSGGTPLTTPIFWALPANTPSPPPTTVPLYEFTKNSNPSVKAYTIETTLAGYNTPIAIARVWVNPIKVRLPVNDYLPSLIADAGGDKCPGATGGTASVTLHGGISRNTEGTITSYQWSWTGGGSGSASGVSPTVVLPPGLYNIVLTVTGSGGNTDTDNVVVRVSP